METRMTIKIDAGSIERMETRNGKCFAHLVGHDEPIETDWETGDDELLPCPFCGAEAYVIPQVFGIQEHKDVLYSISCMGNSKGCGWTFFLCETRQEAIDAWNRRA